MFDAMHAWAVPILGLLCIYFILANKWLSAVTTQLLMQSQGLRKQLDETVEVTQVMRRLFDTEVTERGFTKSQEDLKRWLFALTRSHFVKYPHPAMAELYTNDCMTQNMLFGAESEIKGHPLLIVVGICKRAGLSNWVCVPTRVSYVKIPGPRTLLRLAQNVTTGEFTFEVLEKSGSWTPITEEESDTLLEVAPSNAKA